MVIQVMHLAYLAPFDSHFPYNKEDSIRADDLLARSFISSFLFLNQMNSPQYAWVPLSNTVLVNGLLHPMESKTDQNSIFPYTSVTLSLIIWSTIYYVLQYYNWRQTCEWNCRIVTTFHAIISTMLSYYSSFVVGPNPVKEPGLPISPTEHFILVVSLGYFCYDLFWCLYHQSEGNLILFHHVSSVLCLSYPLSTGVSAGEVVVSLVIMEITNPVLQLRWYLREIGQKNSTSAKVADAVFIFMFFIMRMVCGTYCLIAVGRHPRPTWTIKIGGLTFMIISYIFMFMIFRYAYRKYVLRAKKPIPTIAKQSIPEFNTNVATNGVEK